MTHRAGSHVVHRWHAPHLQLPRLPHLPGLHLGGARARALRDGLIVALCAVLAGGLGWRLRAAAPGPRPPTTPAATLGA
jgi:hypothetical protein